MIGLIWAQARGGVIGRGGTMPWHLPPDAAHFRRVTGGATVVMGRRTWESLPERFRPLPGRTNVVLTRSPGWAAPGAVVAASLEQALTTTDGDAWIIGGEAVYRAGAAVADVAEVTELDLEVEGDTHAPQLAPPWRLVATDPAEGWHTAAGGVRYRFTTWRRAEP